MSQGKGGTECTPFERVSASETKSNGHACYSVAAAIRVEQFESYVVRRYMFYQCLRSPIIT